MRGGTQSDKAVDGKAACNAEIYVRVQIIAENQENPQGAVPLTEAFLQHLFNQTLTSKGNIVARSRKPVATRLLTGPFPSC